MTEAISNTVRAIRESRGLSAAELARRAGIRRQTVYAMEAGSYMPNTAIALRLARALDVSVEELFTLESPAPDDQPLAVRLLSAHGPAVTGQVVQLARVGNHLIGVPAQPQIFSMPVGDAILTRPEMVSSTETIPNLRNRLVIAGCDPAISILAQTLSEAGIQVIAAPCSSRQALEWLKAGRVHVAGSHLKDVATGEYNLPAVRALFPRGRFRIVTFAAWEQGLVVQPRNPKGIRDVTDLARRGVTLVNREPGSGSRNLLDRNLRAARIRPAQVRGYDAVAYGHMPAASEVAGGRADCCIATRAAARAFGLDFIPLEVDRYDFVTRHPELPAIKILLDTLNRAVLRRKLEALAGYDTTQTGRACV